MTDELLTYLKLLADPTRLNIVGLLAQEPRSVDELAAILNLGASTVSHHLTRLHKAGLVGAKAQQYYHIYALHIEALQVYASRLTPEHLAQRVRGIEAVDDEAYARQILARWFQQERLQGIPSQVQHRRVVLSWLAERFEQDKRYDQDQVYEVLEQWCDPVLSTDVCRALVDADLLARLPDGSWYWRTDSPTVHAADAFSPDLLPIAQTPDPNRYTPSRATAKARSPDGAYAYLQEKTGEPSPRVALLRLAIRLKARKHYTAAEIDALISQYSEGDPAAVRAALLQEGLIQQSDEGTYWRERIR